MISLPPSCTLCAQAKHSIWGEGSSGQEEEINISTVISSPSATWRRADFPWPLVSSYFGASRDRQPAFLEGGAGRDSALFCTAREKKKTVNPEKTPSPPPGPRQVQSQAHSDPDLLGLLATLVVTQATRGLGATSSHQGQQKAQTDAPRGRRKCRKSRPLHALCSEFTARSRLAAPHRGARPRPLREHRVTFSLAEHPGGYRDQPPSATRLPLVVITVSPFTCLSVHAAVTAFPLCLPPAWLPHHALGRQPLARNQRAALVPAASSIFRPCPD